MYTACLFLLLLVAAAARGLITIDWPTYAVDACWLDYYCVWATRWDETDEMGGWVDDDDDDTTLFCCSSWVFY